MLRFVLQKSNDKDDLVLMIDETGLDALLRAIGSARRDGLKHLNENELGVENRSNAGALRHVLIDWCGPQLDS